MPENALGQLLFNISREEAERLLTQEPVGTFLFRKDHYAYVLEDILKRGQKISLHCFTLTYLDAEKIVRDRTVVYVHHTWMFYDDDPTLSGPSWNSVEHLLKSVAAVAKNPLNPSKVGKM
jgi:hypothetical protein